MFEFGLRSPYNNWLFIKGLHDYSRKRNVRISLTCILIKPLERALFKIIGMYCASTTEMFKQEPEFISAQLHHGIGGSNTFFNYVVWESAKHFKQAFNRPEFLILYLEKSPYI